VHRRIVERRPGSRPLGFLLEGCFRHFIGTLSTLRIEIGSKFIAPQVRRGSLAISLQKKIWDWAAERRLRVEGGVM
jgi:hypothetical protein